MELSKQHNAFNALAGAVCPNASFYSGFSNTQAGMAPSAQSLGPYCGWYSSSSCCDPATAQSISSSVGLVTSSGTSCFDELNLSACSECSPNAATQVVTCTSFCDKLYTACKGVQANLGGGFIVDPSVSQAQFCLNSTNTQPCFNAASSVIPTSALIIAGIVALFA